MLFSQCWLSIGECVCVLANVLSSQNMPKISEVWKYFTQLSHECSRCKICSKEVKASGNTTNLYLHLQRSHNMNINLSVTKNKKRKATMTQEEEDTSNNKIKLESSSASQQSSESSNVEVEAVRMDFTLESKNHVTTIKPKQARVDDSFTKQILYQKGSKATETNGKLVYMLTKDNLPFRMVEKEGFLEFVKALNPFYKPPSRKLVTKLVEEKYEYLAELTKAQLHEVDALSLTTDIWTDTLNNKSYLGFTAHYIFNNVNKAVTIGVKELDQKHTSENIQMWIKEMLENWRIKTENVVAVISDNAANIKKAIIDNFGTEKYLPCFAHTLNLVPSRIIEEDDLVSPLVKKVKSIVTFCKQSVAAADELRLHKVLKLIQSVDTRWNSTFYMLERFILNSEPITLTLYKFPKAPAMLTALELQTIKEFVDLLKPFEEATKIICGESYVTSSVIIAVLSILQKKLQMCPTKSENGRHLKQALIDQFTKRFEKIESISLIAIATLLDPRFEKIHFNDKLACSKENEEQLCDDLKYYLNQPIIPMGENPIEYWSKNSSPLSTLAKRYMVIVATSVPSERLFSKAGRIITQDRSRLSPKHLHQLLFLASLPKEDWHL